jgi:hypothetical protein
MLRSSSTARSRSLELSAEAWRRDYREWLKAVPFSRPGSAERLFKIWAFWAQMRADPNLIPALESLQDRLIAPLHPAYIRSLEAKFPGLKFIPSRSGEKSPRAD